MSLPKIKRFLDENDLQFLGLVGEKYKWLSCRMMRSSKSLVVD
jgi:hypothetical protein